jgi:mannosyltransferase OCH1-like enzyme
MEDTNNNLNMSLISQTNIIHSKINCNYYMYVYIESINEINASNANFFNSIIKQNHYYSKIFIFYNKSTLDANTLTNTLNNLLNSTSINSTLINAQFNDKNIIVLNQVNTIQQSFQILNEETKYDLNSRVIFFCNTNIPEFTLKEKFNENFELCYQLYGPSVIVEYYSQNSKNIFIDNCMSNLCFYERFFSIDGCLIKKLPDVKSNDHQLSNCNIFNQLLMNFCETNCLYICGINNLYLFNNINILEQTTSYNTNFKYEPNFFIKNSIQQRNLLLNTNNITYDPQYNDYLNKHIDIKYYNSNEILLTVTYFIDPLQIPINDTIMLIFGGSNRNIQITNNVLSNKQSFIIDIETNINFINHTTHAINILQTSKDNNCSRFKYYSIHSILCYVPNLNYVFFSDTGCEQFVELFNATQFNLVKTIYNILKPGAFKADFFRALYIYNYGGIYFDCKMTLFNNIDKYINSYDIFTTEDTKLNNSYNAFFYIKIPFNHKLGIYLKHLTINVLSKYYGTTSFSITGPKIFGRYLNENNFFKHNIGKNKKLNNGFVAEKESKKIIVGASYNNYYTENNYINTTYYNKMWCERNVYCDQFYSGELIEKFCVNEQTQFSTQFSTQFDDLNIKNYVNNYVLCKQFDDISLLKMALLDVNKSNVTIVKNKYFENTFSIPKFLKTKFNNMPSNNIVNLLNKVNCLLSINNTNPTLIIDTIDSDEFNFLTKINADAKKFIEMGDYDILFFEQFEDKENYLGEKKTFNNVIYPLSEINTTNLSYKLYLCKPSVINKINKLMSYSDKLESIVFYDMHVSNFTNYVLSKLKVYVYGSNEHLMDTNVNTYNTQRKNVIKPSINGMMIDTDKIILNIFKIN